MPLGSHRAASGRDVLQGSDRRLLGALTHTAGNQRQVHPDGDGAPQPLDAAGIGLVLQQGALSLHVLQRDRRGAAVGRFGKRVKWTDEGYANAERRDMIVATSRH